MLLTDIIQVLLVRSGQFIVGDLTSLCLTLDQIWAVFEQDVLNYERYFPLTKRFNITVSSSSGGPGLAYDFTHDLNNAGYSDTKTTSVSQSKNLIATPTQSFTLTLPDTPLIPGTLSLLLDSVPAAIDDNLGNLVFGGGFSEFSGTVNYVSGLVSITVSNYPSPATVLVDVSSTWTDYGNPPEYLSKIVPTGFRQTYNNWWALKRTRGYPGQLGRVPVDRKMVNDYRKPILYTTEPGRMDVTAHYYRDIIETRDISQALTEVEIVDLERTKILLDLLYGRFLQIVGQSRAAFVHSDFPITTNADELIRLGVEAYSNAEKDMWAQSDWYNSVRL